jgi:hypothetical protein
VRISAAGNTVSPTDCQGNLTQHPARGCQGPGGKGGGRKQKPSCNGRDRANSLLRKEADFPLVDKEGKARRPATLTEKLGCQATGKTDGRTSPTDWSQINWRKTEGKVRNLRRRIFRAAQQQDWKRVKNLSKLMLRSYSNSLVSTRRVTQINPGRNTPGIDGEVANTSEKRGRLVDTLGCGEALVNGESIDLHHVQPVAEGGTDQAENLRWLHKACHYQTHRQRGKVA